MRHRLTSMTVRKWWLPWGGGFSFSLTGFCDDWFIKRKSFDDKTYSSAKTSGISAGHLSEADTEHLMWSKEVSSNVQINLTRVSIHVGSWLFLGISFIMFKFAPHMRLRSFWWRLSVKNHLGFTIFLTLNSCMALFLDFSRYELLSTFLLLVLCFSKQRCVCVRDDTSHTLHRQTALLQHHP